MGTGQFSFKRLSLLRGTVAVGLCGALALAPMAAQVAAQEAGATWTFGISQSLETESNPGLDRPEAPRESSAVTSLSADYTSVTRTQSLTFSASGALKYGDTDATGFQDPSVSLAYSRQNASARFNTTLFAQERDVDALAFDLGVGPLGQVSLITRPDTGTQRSFGGSVGLTWGLDAPFGGSISVNHSDTSYSGTTDPSLVDSTRTGVSGSLRFDLSPVTSVSVTGSVSDLDEDGAAATSRTESLSLSLNNTRPGNDIGLTFSGTRTDDGTRTGLSLSRSFALARGTLSGSVGIDRSAFGGTGFNGSLAWEQATRNGSFTATLSQALAQDSRDAEIRSTRVSLGLEQALQPRLNGSLSLGLNTSENSQTGISTTTASLTAGLSYALTEDWGLGVTATHQIEDEDGLDRADNTRLSLSINRNFQFRP